MTSQFWISFNANMGSTSDYFYVDKLEVIWLAAAPTMSASDNFESGDGTGGTGWIDDWTLSGDAAITFWDWAYEGWFHLRLRSSTGIAKRSVDLSETMMANLQFWAKVTSFEGQDRATCRVSSDNITWTTVYTWTSAQSDNTYHFYTIDLSSYDLTSQFWMVFVYSRINHRNVYFL